MNLIFKKFSTLFIFLVVILLVVIIGSQIFSSSRPISEESKMFTFKEVQFEKDNVRQFTFYENEQQISFVKAMDLLSNQNQQWITLLQSVLVSTNSAIFWECRPVTGNTMHIVPFEFVIIPSPALDRRTVSIKAFQPKFDELHAAPDTAISFFNLGKDALLIVPAPPTDRTNMQYMTHLSSFLRTSKLEHQYAMWKLVGDQVLQVLQAQPSNWFWLSTSGLGVSWLHIRFDRIPKYYNWQLYKTPELLITK